jgi:hypothetical protein
VIVPYIRWNDGYAARTYGGGVSLATLANTYTVPVLIRTNGAAHITLELVYTSSGAYSFDCILERLG